jgi:hypothetical protein
MPVLEHLTDEAFDQAIAELLDSETGDGPDADSGPSTS